MRMRMAPVSPSNLKATTEEQTSRFVGSGSINAVEQDREVARERREWRTSTFCEDGKSNTSGENATVGSSMQRKSLKLPSEQSIHGQHY
jgi:hypothetical protein